MSEFDRLKAQKDAIVARDLATRDQKVRETVSDGWIQIRTSFYKELLAIATEKATNDSPE